MSGDSLTRSIVQAPSPPVSPRGEAEYDAYHAAVAASERGRVFLAEHARRHRQADTRQVLAAIGRVEAALIGQREDEKLATLRHTVAGIKATLAAVTADAARGRGDNAQSAAMQTNPWDALAAAAAAGAATTRAAAERIQETAWTLREQGMDARICNMLDAHAAEVHGACAVNDTVGKQAAHAVALLHDLERHIALLAAQLGMPPAETPWPPATESPEATPAPHSEAALPVGAAPTAATQATPSVADMTAPSDAPAHDEAASDAAQSVADLLKPSLTGMRRRDATLADIARVMGDLIPRASKLNAHPAPAPLLETEAGSVASAPAPAPAGHAQSGHTQSTAVQPPHAPSPVAPPPAAPLQAAQAVSVVKPREAGLYPPAALAPSPIAVDDFSGFIEAWPDSADDADAPAARGAAPMPRQDTSQEARQEARQVPQDALRDPPPVAPALPPASADTLADTLASLVARTSGLDRLIKRGVAAAFAQAAASRAADPAAPQIAAPAPRSQVEMPAETAGGATGPDNATRTADPASAFVSSGPTLTLREAIAKLQAQRALEAEAEQSAQQAPTATPPQRPPIPVQEDIPRLPPMEAAGEDAAMAASHGAAARNARDDEGVPMSASQNDRAPMPAIAAPVTNDFGPVTENPAPAIRPSVPAAAIPHLAASPAYAAALGSADLDDFLFGETAAPAAGSSAQDEPQSDGSDTAPLHPGHSAAKAKSFAQMLDTSIPWAKTPDPPRPAPAKVQPQTTFALDIDIAAAPEALPAVVSAASANDAAPNAAADAASPPDPLARLRLLNSAETTALFS